MCLSHPLISMRTKISKTGYHLIKRNKCILKSDMYDGVKMQN